MGPPWAATRKHRKIAKSSMTGVLSVFGDAVNDQGKLPDLATAFVWPVSIVA
jgi:hypothetical protein